MGIIVFSLIAMDMEVSEVLVSQVHCVGMIPLQMFCNSHSNSIEQMLTLQMVPCLCKTDFQEFGRMF